MRFANFAAVPMANIAPNSDLRVEISTKQILKIALPISLALLVPQLNFVANTVFLGGLGETELGAAGITGVFYLVFALVGSGLNSGLQALIARRAGENRPEEIGKMFAQSIWIALGLAFINIIITYLLGSLFLSAVLNSDTIQQEASLFISIRIFGLPFLYLFQMGNALLVGTNNSRYMKYGFMAEAVLNVFLDYGLIYGKFGLPLLGFNGAAIASVCAEAMGAVIVFAIIIGKNFHTRFELFKYFRFNKSLSGLIFRQSSPLILQYILSIGAWLLFYILIENSGSGDHSERPLAISNTMRTVFAIFGVSVWAFAHTSNAMVSNIIGQKRQEEVLLLVKKIAKLSIVCTAVISLILNLVPGLFLGIFSKEPAFIAEALPVLRMVSAAPLMMSVAAVCLNAVTGTANTRINLGIEIIAIIVYGLYIYLVLDVWKLSLMIAWASEFVYWTVILLLSVVYLRSGRWKNKVI